jgi:hypothetical protein
MIDNLYNLKQKQINQQVLLKQQVLHKVDSINDELTQTVRSLKTASVNVMGSISDFRVLEIHKATLKDHIVTLGQQKLHYLKQVEQYELNIINLNKESEQFLYIIQEEKKRKIKEQLKQDELVSSEYIQSQFTHERKRLVDNAN